MQTVSQYFGCKLFASHLTGIHPKVLAVTLLIGGVAGVVVTKALSGVVSDLFDVWLSQTCQGWGLLPSCLSRGPEGQV